MPKIIERFTSVVIEIEEIQAELVAMTRRLKELKNELDDLVDELEGTNESNDKV